MRFDKKAIINGILRKTDVKVLIYQKFLGKTRIKFFQQQKTFISL